MKHINIRALDLIDSASDHPDRPQMVGLYRFLYFTRRAIATLREFAEALRLLDRDPDFDAVRSGFAPDARTAWAEAITFFDRPAERFIKDIRNDVGGHFGEDAAKEGLRRLRENSTGKMELNQFDGQIDMRLHFVSEIVATALLPHLKDEDIANFKHLMSELIFPGLNHAALCTNAVCRDWVWPRFG